MTIKQAIEKAIEGGWKETEASKYFLNVLNELVPYTWESQESRAMAFLDPLFWQSLGKAIGWGVIKVGEEYHHWKNEWHRFIDHLAEGKDAESFFESL